MRYYKGDTVRIKRNGEVVEVLAATLARVKVKVVLRDSGSKWYGPIGWRSEMFSNEEVVLVRASEQAH
jgi:hypothetical protein